MLIGSLGNTKFGCADASRNSTTGPIDPIAYFTTITALSILRLRSDSTDTGHEPVFLSHHAGEDVAQHVKV